MNCDYKPREIVTIICCLFFGIIIIISNKNNLDSQFEMSKLYYVLLCESDNNYNKLYNEKCLIEEQLDRQIKNSTKYDSLIQKYSIKYDVDYYLVKAIMKTESNFRFNADSGKAYGLMQLTEQTAIQLDVNRYKISDNVEGGVKYIAYLINKFNSIDKAIIAYNAGPYNVIKYDGMPPFKETKEYIVKVKNNYKELSGVKL